MHIKCPHCLNAIAVVQDRPIDTLTCPSCGSNFNLVDVNTATYGRAADNKIGRFELVELLGSGHFGDVWLAKDSQLERPVAVKLPRKEDLLPADVELFLREARSAAQLKHPNIVSVHEVGNEGGRIYIVSDVVRGPNLADWLLENKLSPQQAAELCATLCEAVHYAHDQGIIHRDLKPSNVLLDSDNAPHLTDFGLAKRDGGEITVTMDGKILGTPAYMSPEQARGDAHNADRRSDVYSLGVILYELLTGQRPFSSKSKMMMIHRVLHEDPKPLRSIDKSVPRNLETICLKAMEKAPEKRYQTSREMADDLKRYLEGKPILARPASRMEKAWRWSRRNRSLAASIVVVTLLACGLAGTSWRNRHLSQAMEPLRKEVEDLSSTVEPLRKSVAELTTAMEPLRHTVRITTDPEEGAEMLFVPLDPKTGEPQPENSVKGGKSPVSVKLIPGPYLVVAYFDDERFHEVFRFVPEEPQAMPEGLPHWSWRKMDGGIVQLRPVTVFDSSARAGMVPFPGSEKFAVGFPNVRAMPQNHRNIPPFYLDPHEVTVGKWKARRRATHPEIAIRELAADHAMCFVSWDQAVAYAETNGKRLPDEVEYEFAATNEGRWKFPWGDEPPVGDWPIGAVGQPVFDRLNTVPPTTGLYSNVAEWTSTWGLLYPTAQDPHLRLAPSSSTNERVVRGGPQSMFGEPPQTPQILAGPRERVALPRFVQMPGVGFRCARSARPRTRPEDFIRVVP